MSQKENITNISHFFTISGYDYQVFDLSRRIASISMTDFRQYEDQQTIYPTPFQKQAWLGLLFWPKDKPHETVIWFLKFPLDELGYIDFAARDGFLNQILNQLGHNIASKHEGKALTDTLKESPYAFKPSEDKMAIFHAIATHHLSQPISRYYEPFQSYLQSNNDYDQWQSIGLQGIADFIVLLDQNNNQQRLAQAIPHLPNTPLITITQMLEHGDVKEPLTSALIKRLNQEQQTSQPDPLIMAGLVRGLSNAQPDDVVINSYRQLLRSSSGHDIQIISALLGRAWKHLKDPQLMNDFLDQLAHQEQMVFNTLIDGSIALGSMREAIMQGFRYEKRSALLSAKIAGYMQRFH